MNLKKLKIISIILVIMFSLLTHSIYDKFSNIFTSFLFPVNESIWEHMKMIYVSYILSSVIEYILIKKFKLQTKNFKSSIVFNIVFNICFYLIIYIPIYKLIGHNSFITISTYFISIIITELISYKILINNKEYKFLNKNMYVILLIILLIFIYLTYYPIKNDIFIDNVNKKIGINNYY